MSTHKRIARAIIPRALRSFLKRLAIQTGLMEDPARMDAPLEYPFLGPMQAPTLRPNYRWGILAAARMAQSLGLPAISVVEFGVAGGNGLVEMESLAREAAQRSGVRIDVYGFDTGTGLPKPVDYRDLPQMWREGFYGMDVDALKARLSSAQLLLGEVSDTVPEFIKSAPAPIGFIAFDMDLYSSTVAAFQLFEDALELVLPRVVCYFDDIIGFSHSDFTGERLAISEFNQRHAKRKLSKMYGLQKFLKRTDPWLDMMYLFHAFEHPLYGEPDGWHTLSELPLVDSSSR
ncbi:hypothetical protein ATO7_04670 [Oceanococcus atlanticus]|uniref:Class I SAM-dependent methyltransferase n=1 Tax=Oceanococcus atlanticus TaxID=1317117 RepID=A0A1Y1SHJ9_9GAMM|nr:hypothetical protein [Oceanococcus atlanticus]ORE89143.1 hypothetical protein ATO7_04670 [Oceanococcus atlanticus]